MAPQFARMTARAIVSQLPGTRSGIYWTRVKAHPTSSGWTIPTFQLRLSRLPVAPVTHSSSELSAGAIIAW